MPMRLLTNSWPNFVVGLVEVDALVVDRHVAQEASSASTPAGESNVRLRAVVDRIAPPFCQRCGQNCQVVSSLPETE